MLSRFSFSLSFIFLFFCFNQILKADAISYQSAFSLEETEKRLEAFLEKFDPKRYKKAKATEGFTFAYKSSPLSFFKYTFYGGTISIKNPTVVFRIEGNEGDNSIMRTLLYKEKILRIPEFTNSQVGSSAILLKRKSHVGAQIINLIFPAFSILYQAKSSPRLSKKELLIRSVAYTLADVAAIYIGGTNFFRERYNPTKNSSSIHLLLLSTRISGAVQAGQTIAGHNRIVKFAYRHEVDW